MMSGPMSTTAKSDGAPVTRLPDRARWLESLTQDERDTLSDMALREVDARFAAWLRAEGAADGDRPG